MRERLEKWRDRAREKRRRLAARLTGGTVAVVFAGVLVMWGMPAQQAQQAGQAAGVIYETVKGHNDDGSKAKE